jgi:hypothetical protein
MSEGPIEKTTFLTADGETRWSNATQEWLYDVARGSVTGASTLSKFGYNASVGATLVDIWENQTLYSYPAAAITLNISSTDGKDRDSSSGAKTVQVYGLDGNYDEVNETVSLSGTTAVSTVASFIRVFRAIVRTAGADGANQGTISIKDSSSSAVLAIITTPHNQTLMTHWTVPAGKTFYMTEIYTSDVGNQSVEIDVCVRPFNEVFQVKRVLAVKQTTVPLPICPPLKITEKSDIVIRGKAAAGAGIVAAGYSGWYE